MPTPVQLLQGGDDPYMTGRSAYDVNYAFTPGPAQTPIAGQDSSYLYNSAIGGNSPIVGPSDITGAIGGQQTIDNSRGDYSHTKVQGSGNVTSTGRYGLYSGANKAPMSPFLGGGTMNYSPLPGGASPRGAFGSNAISSPILNPTSAMGAYNSMQSPIAAANTSSYQ